MGNQVIYLPQNETFGGNLGKGVSKSLSDHATLEMQRRQDQIDAEANMRALNMMKRAGSRDKALEILTTPGLIPFKNAKELEMARKFVDEMYPQADLTPTKVDAYDKTTGDPMSAYVPKNQLGNPENLLKALGPNATLRKPDLVDFFAPVSEGGEMKSMGRRPRTDQSEGEFTAKEIEINAAADAARRAEETAKRG